MQTKTFWVLIGFCLGAIAFGGKAKADTRIIVSWPANPDSQGVINYEWQIRMTDTDIATITRLKDNRFKQCISWSGTDYGQVQCQDVIEQSFNLIPVGTNIKLQNRRTGTCIGSTASGNNRPVVSVDCDSDNAVHNFAQLGGGLVRINTANGGVFDSHATTRKLVQWSWFDNENQKWLYEQDYLAGDWRRIAPLVPHASKNNAGRVVVDTIIGHYNIGDTACVRVKAIGTSDESGWSEQACVSVSSGGGGGQPTILTIPLDVQLNLTDQ